MHNAQLGCSMTKHQTREPSVNKKGNKMEIKQIYLRDSEAAFENAIKKGHAHVCDTHMYMYTKYGNGKPYDVFKHIMTRRHETVDVEPDA